MPIHHPRAQGNPPLFVLRGANLAVTTDQAFTKVFSGTNYQITGIYALAKSGAVAALTAGGIYTAATKGGSALVAAAQVWTGLTAAGKLQTVTLGAPIASDVQTATPILSLTTASGTAATADIFITGVVLD